MIVLKYKNVNNCDFFQDGSGESNSLSMDSNSDQISKIPSKDPGTFT